MTEQNAVAERKSDVPIVNGLIQPKDFDGMWRIANMYAQSGMVPKQYTGNPAAIIVAGQFGAELGFTLMPSLQNVAVINGNPTLWGDAMLAVVRNSETLEVFVEFYTGKPFDDDFTAVCIAKRTRVGYGEYNPEDSLDTMRRKGIFVNEYSMADAKRADLLGKDNWRKAPKRMLKMRARSFTLRDGWPDKLKGMHSAEEMMDAIEVVDVKAKNTWTVTREEPKQDATNPMIPDEDLAAQFDDQAKPDADMNAWLEAIGKRGNMTLAQVKAEIIRDNDLDNCLVNYKRHMDKVNGSKPVVSNPPAPADAGPAEEPKPETNPWSEDAWKNLRGPGVKSLAEEHRETLAKQPKALRDAFRAKWGRCKELESLMYPFNDAGQWIGYIKPDFTARNDPGERPTQAPAGPVSSESNGGRPMGANEMAMVERYNDLLPKLDKDGRTFAAKAAGCEKTVNGFARPTMEIMPRWIEAAETYLGSKPGHGDDAGEDEAPGFMDDEKY